MLKNAVMLLKKPAVLWPLLVFWMFNFIAILFSVSQKINIIDITGDSISTDIIAGRVIAFFVSLILGILLFFAHIAVVAGVGSAIKSCLAAKNCLPTEFFAGIGRFYEKVMLIFFSILGLLTAYSVVIYVIQKILVATGIIESLQSVSFGIDVSLHTIINSLMTMLVVCLVSPFFALWIPAVILDDMKLSEGFKKSLDLGWLNYVKLFFVACIYYIPSVLYLCITVVYELVKGKNTLTTQNVFVTFAALETVSELARVIILSIVIIYLFVLYREVKSGMRHRAAEGVNTARP